jgi:dipeptidyl aminopeptidase/acylaminoacyl peptidase
MLTTIVTIGAAAGGAVASGADSAAGDSDRAAAEQAAEQVAQQGSPASAQPVPPTPNEADVPRPVSGEIELAGSERPDILRFLNVRRAVSPELSPDGRRVAFSTAITGTPQLWIVDAAGGWPRQLTFGEPVTFHAFSPTGEWIAYGADRGGDEREGFYLVTPDGTRERELLAPSDAFRRFGGFSPDGSRIAYATTGRTGRDFDIHVLDVESGEDRRVFTGEWGFFVAAWRPDGGALLLSETRGEDGNDVHLLDLATGELDTLFAPEVSAGHSGFAWTPDGAGFYLATDQDRDFSALARYDVAARRLEVVEAPPHDVEAVALSADGRFLLWTTNEGGWSVLHGRDLVTGDDLAAPELPPGVVSGVETARRAPVAAFTVSGPQLPGDVWTWDLAAGTARRSTFSDAAGLDLSRLVVPTHVDFPARDGEKLRGLLYLPTAAAPAEDGGKPPVLLALHGGPTAQARPDFDAVHQYLIARGIAVFDLNFRGSTGYGKRFARLDNQRLRPNAVLDLEDAMRWLAADGRVDATRAAVMGGSYGGYLTFAALADFPGLFDAGVSFVGVSNWVTALEGASPALKASDRLEYGDIDDPEDREFFRQLSPITRVDRVADPLMVVHGANDPRDPVTESDQLVRAVRERGGRVEYLRFPDEGHGIRKLDNRVIAYRRIAAFLERELGLAADGTRPHPAER